MQHEDPRTAKVKRPSRASVWLALPLAALTMALAVGLAFKHRLLSHLEQDVQSRLPPPIVGGRTTEDGRLSDSLLTDSILSIIQNYYVDPDRTSNRSLLETALAALATSSRIKTGSSPGSVWVEIDGDRRLFPLKDRPSYQDVLDVIAGVSRMLDDAGIVLAGAEGPEKNAPGNVSLLNALLAELDAHSALLSPDAYRELRQGTEGAFGGLGVLVGIRDNLLTVIKPLPRSPAARAGIKKRDRILGIDGTFTYGYALDDLVEFMRGDPGTEVNLSVLRDGAHAPSDLTLKREIIQVDSVATEEINRHGLKVLHLTIDSFATRTSREVLGALKRFRAKSGGKVDGLVLDLRSNPGGLLDQAVQVADIFLKSGVIVTTRGRRDEVENAGGGYNESDFPMVVLIDGDSASASEIVAGALQDHQRAVVVGQPSFGKGSVQTIFELPGERALKLTIARYYTPAGRSIQNVGIIPDVWLQPVAKTDANDNLLGPYRYKNERFLHSHLESPRAGSSSETAGIEMPKTVRQPARKAYYLASPRVDGEDDVGRPDQEMDVALKVIEKVRGTYGEKLPDGTLRASHWLGLAGPAIADIADRLDREAVRWLSARHRVDWHALPNAAAAPNIELRIVPATQRSVAAGETLTLAWTVVNHEAVTLSRTSLFVRSEVPGFETKEELIGTLPAGAERSGTTTVQIPSHWDPGALPLRVGLAADAWPVPNATAEVQVQVMGRPVAQLTAKAQLVDEVGGRQADVLEGREKARLRIDLQNVGEAKANDLQVKIINLAGSQVQVQDQPIKIQALEQGTARQLFVDIEAAKTLYTPELAFGLYVESPDLRLPFRQRFTIKGAPNAAVSAKAPGMTSH